MKQPVMEFLQRELIKEKKEAEQARKEMDFCKHTRNKEHIEFVINLIKAHKDIN